MSQLRASPIKISHINENGSNNLSERKKKIIIIKNRKYD